MRKEENKTKRNGGNEDDIKRRGKVKGKRKEALSFFYFSTGSFFKHTV